MCIRINAKNECERTPSYAHDGWMCGDRHIGLRAFHICSLYEDALRPPLDFICRDEQVSAACRGGAFRSLR